MVFAGCSPASQPDSSSKPDTSKEVSGKEDVTQQTVTLRFSWWGADTRHQATLAAMELYSQRNPNVKIEGEYGAFSTFYQKLLTQLAGRTAPDIISVDYKWTHDLMKQGSPFVNMYR